MKRNIDEYNKTRWKSVFFRLKPSEKELFDKILNNKKLSIRKYILLKMKEDEK